MPHSVTRFSEQFWLKICLPSRRQSSQLKTQNTGAAESARRKNGKKVAPLLPIVKSRRRLLLLLSSSFFFHLIRVCAQLGTRDVKQLAT